MKLDKEALSSFCTLVERICSSPILRLPRSRGNFSLDTDASADAIGCALFQADPETSERYPIGYWSRNLNKAERNYSASERECLALVFGVTTCRPYLQQEHFVAYTDHAALRWLMNIEDPSGRLQRWRLRLSEYNFTVMYKLGKDNTIADAASRLDSNAPVTEE